MATSNEIRLFDLASRHGHTWSSNTWKIRLLFNYKGLEYTTQYIEYGQVKTTLEKYGPPNSVEGKYTVPTAIFPDNVYVTDSKAIALEIEKRYPEKPIQIDSPYLATLEPIIKDLFPLLAPVLGARIPRTQLAEPTASYFHKYASNLMGKDVDELEKEAGGDITYTKVQPLVSRVSRMLQEHPEGPFFQGSRITWADFVWVAHLQFWKQMGEGVYEGILGDGLAIHAKIHAAFQPWLERNDR